VTTSHHDIDMVGEGGPSTSFLAAIGKDVDTDRSLFLGRAFGPTRGSA
jgi:hypothetical protein